MDEVRFWGVVEAAWEAVGVEVNRLRWNLAGVEARLLDEGLDGMVANLRYGLDGLGAAELLAFDRVLERKLYEVDRKAIYEYTGGSEEDFLKVRGFMVGMGQGYYEAVLNDPARALLAGGCEEICFVAWRLYDEKFGKLPRSEISRESGSNAEGWSF
jgi:hypothetical protein